MNNYDLSIIIPAYNCEKYIERCVKSIINQKNNLIEIIIINDGSTDNTLEICKNLENQYKNIKIIDQENSGVSYSRNIGVEKANGKYIMFVDADDYIEENSLEEIQELIQENIDVLRYSHYIKEKNRDTAIIFENKTCNLIENKTDFFKDFFQQTNQNMIWGQAIKKELLKNVKLHENIFFAEDLLFNSQLYNKCQNIKYTKTILYNYKQNEGSVTRNYKNSKVKSKIENLIYVFNEIMIEFKELPITLEIENKFIDEIVTQIMMLTFDEEIEKKQIILQIDEILNNDIFKKVFKDIDKKQLTMCKYKSVYKYMVNKETNKVYTYAQIYKKLKMIQQFIKNTF